MFVTDPQEDRKSLESANGPVREEVCAWFTDTLDFRYWLLSKSECKAMIIQGSPGTGKTMLAIYMTKYLEALSGCLSPENVIYFFCDQGNIYKNSATAVLRGLIWQLCRLNPRLTCHGLEKVEGQGNDRVALACGSVEILWKIFVAMIRDPAAGTITCVLDGINECDDPSVQALESRFSDLLISPRCPQNFRLFATCHKPSVLMRHEDAISVLRLDLELRENDTRYIPLHTETEVKLNVDRIVQNTDWSQELHNQVVNAFVSRTNQSLLWAGRVLADFGYGSQPYIPLCLQSLLQSVHKIHHRALQKVLAHYHNRVRLLLCWVLFAFHPLTLEELNALMGDQISDPENRAEDLMTCVKLCGSFLVIRAETRKSGLGYKNVQTVQLSQHSLRRFLLKTVADGTPDTKVFQLFPDKDHERIASRCLDLMEELLPVWSEGKIDERCNLVLPYATRFWFKHLRECPQLLEDDKVTTKALKFLTRDHANRGLWFTYLSKFRDAQEYVKKIWTSRKLGHHFPTINGLGEITDVVLYEQPKDLSSAEHLNALQLASLLGVTPIVRNIIDTTGLVEYLRQTNIRSSLYNFFDIQSMRAVRISGTRRGLPVLTTWALVSMTPLELAVLEGHGKVVSLLLKRHPRSSMRPDSRFALETAISRCDRMMTNMLIEAGASKFQASRNFDGVICTAINYDRLDVVKFLTRSDISHWVHKDSKRDEMTQALLMLANDSKHNEARFEEYAKVLLGGAASPDGITSYHKGSGLRYWKYRALQSLHSHGITLQALGPFPDEQTPLMLAISSMHLGCSEVDLLDTIQFLLDSGASVNRTDRKGWTALHHVANQIALRRVKKDWEKMEDTEEYKLYQIADLLIAAGIDQDLFDKEKRRAADILQVVGAPVWKSGVLGYDERSERSETTKRMSLE